MSAFVRLGKIHAVAVLYFGHLARASPREDHHRVVMAALQRPPPGWKRLSGRPATSWLRTAKKRPQSRLNSAWCSAQHPTELTSVKLTARLRSLEYANEMND